jgi:hypothetical protein
MTSAIVLLVVAFFALPLVVFRGRTLRRYLAFEVATYAFAAIVWWVARPPDPYLALIACAVLKLAAFSVGLAGGREVVWSANRAALIAAIVFAFVIPTQIRTPIDGDEPFYLLMTESLVKDHDLDLANQYADLAHSATGRTNLKPQIGDTSGPRGEQYSRLEPFLSLLLVPGYAAARLPGALLTMALFAVLLVRSTIRLFEDEGIESATVRALFPLLAFAPPIVFYAARIWPEVPGAFFFVEALRGVRNRRPQRWVPALIGLSLLKVRFVLIAIAPVVAVLWRHRSTLSRRRIGIALAILALPMIVGFVITGSILSGHAASELLPSPIAQYVRGLFGLLLDGWGGIVFQAPIYLLGVFALVRWRDMPDSFRLGSLAAVPYLFSLLPRSEWHGGWSPPLRYIVVFMPLLLLGAAALWQRVRCGGGVAVAALWSIGLTIHGLAFPWRLFHIENGENPAGEWLSTLYHTDFSRLFPSFVRLNGAAIVASVAFSVLFLIFALRRVPFPQALYAPLVALGIAAAFAAGRSPADRIEFEDAHVVHSGGELAPKLYTVARFLYRSGWIINKGEAVSFLARRGGSTVAYACAVPTTIALAGRTYTLRPTGNRFGTARVDVPRDGRVSLRCLAGRVALDWMQHD